MIVLIVISILLVGTTSFISALGYTSYVRNAIGIILTPVQNGANYVFDSIENIFSSKEDFKKLKEENEELKSQLAEQKEILANAQLALKENEELKNYLGIKKDTSHIALENAYVTGRQSASHTLILTVNKGTYHGIKPGMPVIDKYGIVGKVSETGLNWSKVTFVTQPNVSFGVKLEKTGDKAIAKGTYTSSKEGLCAVTYFPESTSIEAGDRIVSSDDSVLLPEGILLGVVERVETDAVTREITAYVRPASNFTEVQSVAIITEYERSYE